MSRFAAGSLDRARARQMECRKKTRFKPANEPVEAGFSLRILLFVLIMTSLTEKNCYERAWFYTQKRMYRFMSLAFISGSIVLYASYLCLSLIYCLTHVECFRFFMATNIDFVWRRFEASLQLAFDLLSTCLRHAHASLRPGLQPGLQLARIMEFGLHCHVMAGCIIDEWNDVTVNRCAGVSRAG